MSNDYVALAVSSWNSWSQSISSFRFEKFCPGFLVSIVLIGLVGASIFYLILIQYLRKVMEKREKFEIRLFSLVHNFNMFAISVICFLGLAYGTLLAVYNAGDIEVLFCDAKNTLTRNGPLQFWQYVFWLSKIYELIDTVILCLRKSDIIFLHLYHHWITNLLCFWTLYFQNVSSWSATSLNALVHIPMYLYYWLAIAGFRDLWFKKYITQLQIAQFFAVIGLHTCSVSTGFIWHYGFSKNCHSYADWYVNVFGMCVMVSYLILFLGFYKKSYVEGGGKKGAKKPEKSE